MAIYQHIHTVLHPRTNHTWNIFFFWHFSEPQDMEKHLLMFSTASRPTQTFFYFEMKHLSRNLYTPNTTGYYLLECLLQDSQTSLTLIGPRRSTYYFHLWALAFISTPTSSATSTSCRYRLGHGEIRSVRHRQARLEVEKRSQGLVLKIHTWLFFPAWF